MAERSSSQSTLKPSAARTSSSSPHKSPSSGASLPKPPLSTHPSATVSEQAYFQGTHPIAIGAGTVIHPRAKLLSFEGPISIGEGCIIGEKAVIGGGGPSGKSPGQASTEAAATGSEATASTPTIIENAVQIGPLATISEGAHISSAATVDTSASLGKYGRIGKHSKVCPSCHIPDDAIVEDWIVVWGGGTTGDGGTGLQRRRRPHNGGNEAAAGLGAGDVEDARLTALSREREGLTKLIGVGTGQRRR